MSPQPALSNDQQTAFNHALSMGVERKDANMMRLALQNGAEPNRLLFDGIAFKPRWRDYFNDENADKIGLRWAKLAVEFGADVKAEKTDDQKKPRAAIHWLYDNFSPALMDYMIEQGAGVDTKSPFNNTMLMRAVSDGKPDLVNYFLTKGADPMEPCGEKGIFPLKELENSDKFKPAKKAELLMAMMNAVHSKNEPPPAPQAAAEAPDATTTHHDIAASKTVKFKKPAEEAAAETVPAKEAAPVTPTPAEKRSFTL